MFNKTVLIIIVMFTTIAALFYKINKNNLALSDGKIVFQSDRGNSPQGLYVIDKKGLRFIREGSMPYCQPNTRKIVYVTPKSQLAVMDAETEKEEILKSSFVQLSQYPSPAIYNARVCQDHF